MFGWYFEVDAWSRFRRWNLIRICVRTCDVTSRSYFGKMNSTLGPVVPLAMFLFLTRFFFCSLTCLFRVSQLAAGKTQSLRRGERGSRDGEVSEQISLALLHIYPQPSRWLPSLNSSVYWTLSLQVGGSQELGGSKASLSTLGTNNTTGRRRERRKSDSASIIPDAQVHTL